MLTYKFMFSYPFNTVMSVINNLSNSENENDVSNNLSNSENANDSSKKLDQAYKEN